MMQSPWGPRTSPHQRGSLPQSCGQALYIPFTPSFTAVQGISPPCSYPQLATSYEIWGTWLEVQARVPGCSGMASSSATPSYSVSGAVGHSKGQQLPLGWHSATRATLAWPQTESWEQALCLPRPGLQILFWMIWISLEFQPSQAERDCLHTHHMDYYKNTHLSLPKVPRADSGGHGL